MSSIEISSVATYFRYDVTGIRMEAPGNSTPSMISSGSLRGNLMDDEAIVESHGRILTLSGATVAMCV